MGACGEDDTRGRDDSRGFQTVVSGHTLAGISRKAWNLDILDLHMSVVALVQDHQQNRVGLGFRVWGLGFGV